MFILFSLFEYFSYSNTAVRTVLFFSFIALSLATLIAYIIIPVTKIFGLGKQLTQEEIAHIIGQHFEEIDDKLLNLFELQKQMDNGNYQSYDLLAAAIDTKIESLKPFSFIQAIPFEKTKKFARFALIPILLFILLFALKKELFIEPTQRIVHYSTEFEKPAPYSIVVTNRNMRAFQHDDFTVQIKVEGDEVPDELFIKYKNRSYKCHKISNTEYDYVFSNIQQNVDFQLFTDEFSSVTYTVEVLPKPVTIGYEMQLHYPAYLNKPDEVLENIGNATVPEGTRIEWKFFTKNSDNLIFIVDGETKTITSDNDQFVFQKVARNSFSYALFNKNSYFTSRDTISDNITVIKDLYPEIVVMSQQDSAYSERYYFKGNIKDDYGFSKLQFVYDLYDAEGHLTKQNQVVNIAIQNHVTLQDFYYYFDANSFDLKPGEKINYYFKIYDNDGVNGPKAAKSTTATYRVKTLDEINEDLDKSEKEVMSDFSNLVSESAQLMKDIEKLQKQMMQEKELSWQDKKKLEQLMNQYQDLKEAINKLQNQQKNNQAIESQYKDIQEDILKKQQELQKRMEDVLSDEMKQMMDKLQQMMNQSVKKDDVQKQVQKLKNNTEDINKTLDQQLQLYKQLEVEKKLNEAVQNLRNLSEELDKNAKNTENKSISKDQVQQKQKQIQEQYNEVKKEIQELLKMNSELEEPTKFKDTKDLQQQIDNQLQQSSQNLDKNNRSKSSDNQKKAAEDMDRLADQMEQDFNESELESVSEDIETLRQILDNLVKISFSQESIMTSTQKVPSRSSKASDLMLEQFQVKNNMAHIADSLNALARRQMSVKPFIQTEVSKIEDYLSTTQTEMNDRRMANAAKNQQFALTSMNNLALMLNESLQEMQKKKEECKSKCNKSGNGSCSKPGGKGKSKKTSARELQQQLNRQMEALKKSMEKDGQQGQTGQQQQMSEKFAKMAAQQEAIRKMLEDYNNEMKSENGVGDKSLEQLINDMKKTEKELVNRTLTQQTIQRQQSITTRLLKSERADIEKEKDEERKSNEAKYIPQLNPPKEWNFDVNHQQQNEMLRSVPAELNHYYKEKANEYFYNID
ncbi:MAG: hypothetical protein J6T86_04890 [Bacteroidales bacterium]|nr:hypothetical protein [Bacteroidales bacterium]